MVMCEKILMKLETASKPSWFFFAIEEVSPPPVELASPTSEEGASLPQSERINPALPEKMVMASPEAVANQDNANSL